MNHSIGGCNQFLGNYQKVGNELRSYESVSGWRLRHDESAFQEFHGAVAFMSVEVLESFRDDLLDLKVSDDALFISGHEQSRTRWSLRVVAWLGIVAGIIAGMIVAARHMSIYSGLGLTGLIAGPVLILHELIPRRHTRRMLFAQVLSREISLRRGHDDDQAAVHSGFDIRSLVRGHTPPSAVGSSRVRIRL